MIILHQIGPRETSDNFNTLDEILASEGPISFDGVYESVYSNYKALKGKDITFFPSGAFMGGNNQFDVKNGQPLSRFCTWDQIREMCAYLGAKIGYHGWAHQRVHELKTDDELCIELRPPPWFIKSSYFNWAFAWPHGEFNPQAIRMAKALGYREAWSTHIGDGSLYAQARKGLGRD